MDVWSWGWLILAAVLLVGEMVTAGFFLIVFGIGAIGSFLVAVLGGSVLWQWITFLVVSALSLLMAFMAVYDAIHVKAELESDQRYSQQAYRYY